MIVYSSNKLHNFSRQVSRLSQQKQTDLSEMIAEEFGANAEYVQGLLERFRTNPELVDDSWRSYFNEILGEGAGPGAGDGLITGQTTAGNGAKAAVVEVEREARVAPKETSAAAAPAPERKPVEVRPPADVEVVPLRGPALKIVENMESSLSVPTATSERRIPVNSVDL